MGPPKIIICGAPASGKGTQCEFIREEYGVVHLSTGDMLRAAVEANSHLGLEAKSFMDKGELVPDSTIIGIVMERLQESDCVSRGWLLDGFPRTGTQADALAKAGAQCDIVILLDVPDSILVERVVGRRSDPLTGKIYHMTYSPPEDGTIASRLVQRSDDTEEKVKVRVAAYHKNLASILDKYKGKVFRVDGARAPKAIWRELRPQVYRMTKFDVVFVLGGPGSGKGTLCSRITAELGYIHLSAGDLLRAEKAAGGAQADMINAVILNGGIVPAEVTIGLLDKAMKASGHRKFLIDGFPRNFDNVTQWNSIMHSQCTVDFVLYLECDHDTMVHRLLERGKTSGRSDDNMETIIKRIETYNAETVPVLNAFDRQGKLRKVSSLLPPAKVFDNAAKLFQSLTLIPPFTRTFAFIKPDALSAGHTPAIHAAIKEANLTVIAFKLVTIDAAAAEGFYSEHVHKSFFPSLKQFMTSGPAMAMILEGLDAVRTWRELIGPTNTQVAVEKAPKSLRARFGTDGTQNACHGSDSEVSAAREIDFWFDPDGPGAHCASPTDGPATTISTSPLGLPVEDTFAMIKPGSAEHHYDEIISLLLGHGFQIVGEVKTTLSSAQAAKFSPVYAEHLSSGPLVALHLRRAGALAAWKHLMGPHEIEHEKFIKAKGERPDSIRGLFASTSVKNAVHGSESLAEAQREIAFFFSFGVVDDIRPLSPKKGGDFGSPKSGSGPVRHARKVHTLPSISRTDSALMSAFALTEVDPIMQSLVKHLLIERPRDVASFAINQLSDYRAKKGPGQVKLDPLGKGDDESTTAVGETDGEW